ncbi:unnamed protein product, partial [Ixodes persulcatus]
MRTWVLACLIVSGITHTLGLQGASNTLGSLESLGFLGSTASRLNPIKNGVKASDNSVHSTIPGVRCTVLTDVTQGGHRMVEVFEDTTKNTVLDCNIIGDKAVIEKILQDTTRGFIEKVTKEKLQYFLNRCDAREPNKDKSSFKSRFEDIQKKLKSLFLFPGTKWCGMGDAAENYDHLGKHRGTDMCCRAHDNSDDNIPAGKTKHGITNSSPYTMTNCKDDRKFYNCLSNDGSLSSVAVRKLFFTVLRTNCFAYTYPKKCLKKNPSRITILSSKCEKYELDKSAPKKWQIFPPTSFTKDDFERKRNQKNRMRLTIAENDPETVTENAGVWIKTKEPEGRPVLENEIYFGNLAEGNETSPVMSEEPVNNS